MKEEGPSQHLDVSQPGHPALISVSGTNLGNADDGLVCHGYQALEGNPLRTRAITMGMCDQRIQERG